MPEEIHQFIRQFLSTGVQLEVLLLIATANEPEWNVESVSDELRIAPALAAELLADLHKKRLLGVTGATPDTRFYCYAPKDAAMRQQVATLAALYRERRHSVLAALYERPSRLSG